MRLYDSMTQEKKDFVPRDGDHVTMYFCGPTVYNYVHVGNARPYVVSMVAKRYFESLGYRVTLVENITDIDDRIINKGNAEGRDYRQVAKQFADAYREDTSRLGLGRPDVEPLATEHIQEIIDLIADLVEQGHAYQSGPDVYFDVDSWAEYGKLSKQQVAEMRHGARIDVGEDKADPLDFALWKGAKPGEPAWDSPWGPGRPGWHIECSAMSLKYLGAGFDIHGGGRDLIFPHHENEIAQSEASGQAVRPLLDAQRHAEPELREDVQERGQHPDAARHPRPSSPGGSHHRLPEQPLPQPAGVQRGPAGRDRAASGPAAQRLRQTGRRGCAGRRSRVAAQRRPADQTLLGKVAARRQAFDEALADDLNTAAALAEVFGLSREINAALAAAELSPAGAAAVRSELSGMVHILGLDAVSGDEDEVPADVVAMAEERRAARAARDFARADALRAAITEGGYEVRDAADGFKIIAIR